MLFLELADCSGKILNFFIEIGLALMEYIRASSEHTLPLLHHARRFTTWCYQIYVPYVNNNNAKLLSRTVISYVSQLCITYSYYVSHTVIMYHIQLTAHQNCASPQSYYHVLTCVNMCSSAKLLSRVAVNIMCSYHTHALLPPISITHSLMAPTYIILF